MAEVFQFVPRQGVDAAENVSSFINECRNDLHTFGADLDFGSDLWDVSACIQLRGKTQRVAFVFSSFDTSGSRTKWEPMAEPFLSFAKAKMRYDFGRNPRENHAQKLAAIRALEKALVSTAADGIPRVENVNPHALNLAADYLKKSSPGSAYQSGCHLEGIAKWIVEKQLTRTAFQWKNIIKKREELLSKISAEADEYRLKNIPSKAALNALPQIFANSTDPRDILISSIAAVLFSSPDRFNEVFALSARCEHVDHRPDGTEIYGLRWPSSKGAKPEIRKILRSMEGICRDAIARLLKVTEEARKMACWYEANPRKMYLPKEFEHLRDQELVKASELAPLLGQSSSSRVCRWANGVGLEAVKMSPKGGVGAPAYYYRFEDVERAVCAMLPSGFPVYDPKTGLTCGEALLIVPQNFFHQKRGTWRCMFQAVSINTFNDQIGSGANHNKGSVFSRNNYTEDDGSPINVDSHDFRHYLNYLAKRKGVDQLVLALWSGRKRVADNKRYGDPLTAEKTQMLRDAGVDVAESLGLIGLDVNDPESPLMFADTRDILELQYQYVHETRFGYCIHEYATSPCERRMQCLECTDHLCIKGLKEKTERIREEFEKSEKNLELVEKAVADGAHAAGSKLHQYAKKRAVLLTQLVNVFDDPSHPAGTRIQLTESAADTPLKIAVSSRIALGDRVGQLLASTAGVKSVAGSTVPRLPSGAGATT